jgi:hypothetical protein
LPVDVRKPRTEHGVHLRIVCQRNSGRTDSGLLLFVGRVARRRRRSPASSRCRVGQRCGRRDNDRRRPRPLKRWHRCWLSQQLRRRWRRFPQRRGGVVEQVPVVTQSLGLVKRARAVAVGFRKAGRQLFGADPTNVLTPRRSLLQQLTWGSRAKKEARNPVRGYVATRNRGSRGGRASGGAAGAAACHQRDARNARQGHRTDALVSRATVV